jgi:hypothetical protein
MLKNDINKKYIAIAAIVTLFVFWAGYWSLYSGPDAPANIVDAQIIGFEDRQVDRKASSVKFARVRILSEDKERLVSWPEGRAQDCDPGDIVRLENATARLRLIAQKCQDR